MTGCGDGRAVIVGVGGCGARVEALHPSRPAALDLQAAARRDTQRTQEMVEVGDHVLGGGVDLRGRGAPRPPMSARAGDNSDPLAASMFRCSDNLSPSMDLHATGNTI